MPGVVFVDVSQSTGCRGVGLRMRYNESMKNKLIGLVVLVVVFGGAFWAYKNKVAIPYVSAPADEVSPSETKQPATYKPLSAPAKTQGTAVFVIKDAGVSLDTIASIMLSVKEVSVLSAKGWISISKTPKQYDLIKLYGSGAAELLAEANLESGTYNQIRLMVDKVSVTTKAGVTKDAKLPSGDLKIVGPLVIEKGKTSGITLDFIASKSLHTTGKGEYIFAPVIQADTKTSVFVQRIGSKIELIGGEQKFSAALGMDEGGGLKVGFELDKGATLELVGSVIKIVPRGESAVSAKITAEAALESAIGGAHITSAISIKLTTKGSQKVWRIVGVKDLGVVIVYIDAVTGAFVGTE